MASQTFTADGVDQLYVIPENNGITSVTVNGVGVKFTESAQGSGKVYLQDNPVSGATVVVNYFDMAARAVEVTPATYDYAGIMAARKVCIEAGGGVVRLGSGTYEIGSNYIPLTSGVLFKGNQPNFRFTNDQWTDRDNIVTGGTVINGDGTQSYGFWDGVEDLASATTTVTAVNATFTSGSANISVANSSLFPVGKQVYFTSSGNGVYQGHMYFVLSSGSNIITVGLAEKVAVVATGSGVVQISAGFPNAGTVGGGVENVCFTNIRTAIKSGGINTIGAVYGSFRRNYALGMTGYRCYDFMNFVHATFNYMWSRFGNGHYYGANNLSTGTYDLQPGNCEFTDIYNINESQIARGIVFEALGTDTILNELHVRMIQNNNKGATTITQATSGMGADSPNITVTDGTRFPVDMPLWVSTAGAPNGFTTNLTYFVVSQVGNVIQISATKKGAAINSSGAAAMNLSTKGFPGIEITATPGNKIQNSSFVGLDVEGPSTVGILAQQTLADFHIHQVSGDLMQAAFCGRSCEGIIKNRDANFSTDFDSASAIKMLILGQRKASAVTTNSGSGFYFDVTLGQWVLNMNHYSNPAFPTIKAMNGPNGYFTQPGIPIAQVMLTNDATQTMGLGTGGWTTFNGAAGIIKTLPTISNATATSTLIGYPIFISNASANALTVNTDGTQLFNNQATKTSCTLAAGQWLECIAAKTAGGTFYWIAKTNGTI